MSAQPHYRVFLLGSLQIERDGNLLRLPRRKLESLLAYLVLYPDAHRREKLAALFWGDFPDDQARASLRTHISALNKEFGKAFVLADRETIQLNPKAPLWVDVREVEDSGLRIEDSRLKIGAPIFNLESLISLYRGDLLQDLDEEWIVPLREQYRANHLEARLKLIAGLRASSDYASAIDAAHDLLSIDPANERAYQHLLFLYVVMGNRQAALEHYEKCVRALKTELEALPSPETTALAQWIKQTPRQTTAPTPRLTNLPIPLTSFVGRKQEVAELRAALAQGARMLTCVGAGGSGKTRLAIHVGMELLDAEGLSGQRFPEGVWWIELAALTDAVQIPFAVVQALGIAQSPRRPLTETLVEGVRDKRALLIFDNCEHLLDASAQLIELLLDACSGISILATSREPLGIESEQVWRVPTLSVPAESAPHAARALQAEAVLLFVERARAVRAEFALTDANARAVVEVCRRLDGIPLAIELAAARITLLTPAQIAARLDDRFNLLTGGSRTALPRQQTLRALLDWSYDLLSAQQQVLFRQLAVFAGGFTLEAAEYVCWDSALEYNADGEMKDVARTPPLILDLVSHLVDKSLVSVELRGELARYRMLETIHDYARERLSESGELYKLRARHLEYFLELSLRAAPKLAVAGQALWLERLETEHDNLRAALDCAMEQPDPAPGLELASALGTFWNLRGHHSEGRARLNKLLARQASADRYPTGARAKALYQAGALARWQGDYTTARALLEESLALRRALGDEQGVAQSLGTLGVLAFFQSDYTAARAHLDETIAKLQSLDDKSGMAEALHYLARVAQVENDYALAWELHESSLALRRAQGDNRGIAASLNTMGDVARCQGDYTQAAILYDESLALARGVGNKLGIAWPLHNLAHVALHQDDWGRAALLFRESLGMFREAGSKPGIAACLAGLAGVSVCSSRTPQPGLTMQVSAHFDRAGSTYRRAQLERAARLLTASSSLLERIGARLDPADIIEYERYVRFVRDELDDGLVAELWVEGQAMTWEQAMEYASTL